MKMLLPRLLPAVFAVIIAVHGVRGALVGGKLHSFDEPKYKYYDGPETLALDTWAKANKFCKDQGRIMARTSEWCVHARNRDWRKRLPFGGVKSTEQWVPVRNLYNGYGNSNNYILVGPINGTDYSGICKDYYQYYGLNGGGIRHEWRIRHELFCGVPENCPGNRCLMDCPATAPKGFYPDPNDCGSYCYCAGEGKVSWYESVNATGLIWDPFCRDSKSLYGNDKDPLGGMTGGCPNMEYYVTDKTYCTPALRGNESELAAANETQTSTNISAGTSLRRKSRELEEDTTPAGPHWGISDEKAPFETNAILCHRWPRIPQLPKTCGEIWGDPHVVTYDDLAYSCQGSGDYVLSKSLTSGFELQGRFKKFSSFSATILTGFAFKSGRDDPFLEVYLGGDTGCSQHFAIDGKLINLNYETRRQGTVATGSEKLQFYPVRGASYFLYPESGISIKYQVKNSKAFGCYINIKFCIEDSITEEPLVGLMGSPDGNKTNDFMIPPGYNYTSQDQNEGIDFFNTSSAEGLPTNGRIDWKDGYEYCTRNWCIRNNTDSLFQKEQMASGQCDLPYDSSLEEKVEQASPEVKKICEGHLECLMECSAGDVKDCTDSMVVIRELEKTRPDYPEPDPGTLDEPDPEEQEDITRRTTAEGAPEWSESPNPFAPTPAPKNTPPGSFGDPHIKVWSGETFDFHGSCDLILLDNPTFHEGVGMSIHIRTKIVTWWSYIETAVLRIGSETIEVTGGPRRNQHKYYVNGVEGDSVTDKGFLFAGLFNAKVKRATGHQIKIRVDLRNGDAVGIETFKSFVRVNIQEIDPKWKKFAGAVGLMGAHPTGARIGRDGKTVFTDMNAFGKEWQVLQSEPKLFRTVDGPQHPTECVMPDHTSLERRGRRLGESKISREEAEKACAGAGSDIQACVFDVLATNDLDMAESY